MTVIRLFVSKTCPLCGRILAELDPRVIADDTHVLPDGTRMLVFCASTSDAARDLLDHYGMKEMTMPAIQVIDKSAGETISEDIDEIIQHIHRHGANKP